MLMHMIIKLVLFCTGPNVHLPFKYLILRYLGICALIDGLLHRVEERKWLQIESDFNTVRAQQNATMQQRVNQCDLMMCGRHLEDYNTGKSLDWCSSGSEHYITTTLTQHTHHIQLTCLMHMIHDHYCFVLWYYTSVCSIKYKSRHGSVIVTMIEASVDFGPYYI